jgi:hypothetical protein
MAGFLPADAKAFLLSAIAGAGVFVGLAYDIPSGNDVTLANITEVSLSGYVREAVTWGAPGAADFDVDPIQMANNIDVLFPALSVDLTGVNYVFLTDQASAKALAAPVITTPLAAAASGGTFAAGTYYWVVTALNAKGETIASNEVSKALTANQKQALTWGAVSGATSYNVYRGTVSGDENVLVANVTSGVTYTDTGTAGTSGEPPAFNTAAVGKVYWVWSLPQAISAQAGKPVKAPTGGLIIE